MTGLWILIMILSTMYTVQTGRRWVTAQSFKESPVYQPNKELIVDIGDSATLWCCISEKEAGTRIAWFKQPKGKKPQIIVTIYKTAGETFYSEPFASQLQIGRYLNCFNMTISRVMTSDEAMYYCALITPNIVFADGTYLKLKGDHVTTAPETHKPVLNNNSVVCEPTLQGNSTYMNTHEKTVFSLETALAFCAVLIFLQFFAILTYLILRRRKCDKINASVENFTETGQETEMETLNYAALKFSKQKATAKKIKTVSLNECVYSDVKKL
ncbi:uncharacterized protein Hap1MRO34_012113 isoform 1-T1 [Clarias gariepinus]